VPAPATVELLMGAPVYSSGLEAELVTPTGAAIVKTLAARFASFPPMTIERTGYGAGSRNFPGHANVVRLTVGEARPELATKTGQEIITVLEANLDDLNPQVFGYVLDRLLEEGALDVFGMPVEMKKNRPGMLPGNAADGPVQAGTRGEADRDHLRREQHARRATAR
jgi:uncharacterized protein (DUF111 family)